MRDSLTAIAALRRRVAAIEGLRPTETPDVVALGHAAIDAMLHGGLERGRLHEVFAADDGDASSAAGFASMIVRRVVPDADGAVVWLRQEEAQAKGGGLYAPGLVELGVDPARLVIGILPDPLTLLRVAAEVARCADVAVLVIELWRAPRVLDLTASRRLAVAAEGSGVTALMLRVAAEPGASAAQTRWAVRSAPAVPLAANAPGVAALDIELLRQRGGRAGGRWILEWDRDQAIFRDQTFGEQGRAATPLPGAVVSMAPVGTAGAARRRTG